MNLQGFSANQPISYVDVLGLYGEGMIPTTPGGDIYVPPYDPNNPYPGSNYSQATFDLSGLDFKFDIGFTGSTSFHVPVFAGGGIKVTMNSTAYKGTCCEANKKRSYIEVKQDLLVGVYAGSGAPASVRMGVPIRLDKEKCPVDEIKCVGTVVFTGRLGPLSGSRTWTYGKGWSGSASFTLSITGGSFFSAQASVSGGLSCTGASVFDN